MGSGEPIRRDPEVAVATAATNGGDEVRSGGTPGVPQQSVADEGRMTPPTPTVKVLTSAEIVHYIDARTEAYRTTEVDIKATATIVYPLTEIKIQEGGYMREELYSFDLEYLEKLINEARKRAMDKAAKFINKRNELYALFEKLGVKVEFERIEEKGDC
jgi:hypothetical protein